MLVAVVASLASLLVLPLMAPGATAAEVGSSLTASSVEPGQPFEIHARGTASVEDVPDGPNALTRMHLVFTVVSTETGRVVLAVQSGRVVLNDTGYIVSCGRGVAARLRSGRFEGSIGFGFRVNLTSPDGHPARMLLRGVIVRNGDGHPRVGFRARLDDGVLTWQVRLLARTHRVQS